MRDSYRPVLDIPRTPLETLLEVLAAVGIVATIAMTVWGWSHLPAIIPTHYDVAGRPNSYGGKGSLLTLPILSICLAILLTFVSRFPHRYNYPWQITAENAPRQYYLARLLLRWILFEMVWIICVLQWSIIQAAQNGSAGSILLITSALVLALMVTIILYIRTAANAR